MHVDYFRIQLFFAMRTKFAVVRSNLVVAYQETKMFALPMGHTTYNQRRFDIDITLIRRRPNFHVISAYFFDIISLIEKSTSFPRTFFDIVLLVEIPTLFPRTFFDATLMVEKSMLFTHTFFGNISRGKNSTSF